MLSLAVKRRSATRLNPAPVRGLKPTATVMRSLRDPTAVSFPKFLDGSCLCSSFHPERIDAAAYNCDRKGDMRNSWKRFQQPRFFQCE